MNLLEMKDVSIHYFTDDGEVEAVNHINLTVAPGETIGLVGETGAGKTTAALGIMRLVADPPGKIIGGQILFEGKDLMEESAHTMRKIRGEKISMIFQDPMTSLNPVLTIGDQITEVIKLHEKISHKEAFAKACQMLELVGIPSERIFDYPHQFSGGMKQRVVIAIALACSPKLLIADEPTTALDVTIQAQVIDLIDRLKQENNTAVLLITHDLGVVAEICDKVAIMYAGEIVESGSLEDIYEHTAHPYTKGLFGSIPSLDSDVERLQPIPGMMPDPTNLPEGCSFYPRCSYRTEACSKMNPAGKEIASGHFVKCLLFEKECTANE